MKILDIINEEGRFYPETCPACDGSGTEDGKIGISVPDCPVCDGQGEVEENEEGGRSKYCPHCKGTGTIVRRGRNVPEECSYCGGEGEIHESAVPVTKESKKKWKYRGVELPGKFRSRYDRIPIDADPKTAKAIRD